MVYNHLFLCFDMRVNLCVNHFLQSRSYKQYSNNDIVEISMGCLAILFIMCLATHLGIAIMAVATSNHEDIFSACGRGIWDTVLANICWNTLYLISIVAVLFTRTSLIERNILWVTVFFASLLWLIFSSVSFCLSMAYAIMAFNNDQCIFSLKQHSPINSPVLAISCACYTVLNVMYTVNLIIAIMNSFKRSLEENEEFNHQINRLRSCFA
jgi:magnesium-transporting ATPase (P-type)